MGKKITRHQRRKMLTLHEQGASASEVKKELGITDNRTLWKHLILAEAERRVDVARAEILKESLAAHLDEIRMLIERWKSILSVPNTDSTSSPSDMEALLACENERLFTGIREHLPFPLLWRLYKSWVDKGGEYLLGCEQLHNDIRSKAPSVFELEFSQEHPQPGLTWSFDRPMFNAFSQKASGKAVEPRYLAGKLRPDGGEYLQVNGAVVLCVEKDAAAYQEKYQQMLDEYLESAQLANIIDLFRDLRRLETEIHALLEEALLRRDYILYTCRLCPGQGQLVG